MEKHQYGFAVMNFRTGGTTRKSFWGRGVTEEECKKDALRQANAYAEQKTDEAYRKACMRDRSGYRPSSSSYEFQVVGCSLWK
jgi:hypothetical protein